MAAGPISERNQGDWRGRARNGLGGLGGPTMATSVSVGAGDWASPGGARPARCLLGAGRPGSG